jgi:hypothetical protein
MFSGLPVGEPSGINASNDTFVAEAVAEVGTVVPFLISSWSNAPIQAEEEPETLSSCSGGEVARGEKVDTILRLDATEESGRPEYDFVLSPRIPITAETAVINLTRDICEFKM